MILGIN